MKAITRAPRPALLQCHECGSRAECVVVTAGDDRIVREAQSAAADTAPPARGAALPQQAGPRRVVDGLALALGATALSQDVADTWAEGSSKIEVGDADQMPRQRCGGLLGAPAGMDGTARYAGSTVQPPSEQQRRERRQVCNRSRVLDPPRTTTCTSGPVVLFIRSTQIIQCAQAA